MAMIGQPHEIVGNIWELHKQKGSTIVIPTNGTVTKLHNAVMGRGLAADAVRRHPTISAVLGERLHTEGLCVMYFPEWRIFTFPVKYEWHEDADLSLIQRSTKELQLHILRHTLKNVLVPRVGCGNGRLTWATVRPVLATLLDHRCTFVTWNKEM